MVQDSVNDSGSGSDSESDKESRSPSPNRSDDGASQGGARSRSRSLSRSPSQHSAHSKTHSRSPSRSRSASSRSKSGSRSPSQHSAHSKSPSRSPSQHSAKSKTHSRSPSQHSAHSKTHSRSPSQHSAHSKTHSRSPSQHSAHSKTHSRSPSQHSAHSKSRSRSASAHSVHSKSNSRSASAHSDSGSDIGAEKRKRQVLSDSGSDAEKAIPKRKKSALIDSDSEPDEKSAQQEEENVDATELFGDADDISTDEETRGKGKSRSSSEDDVRRGSDNDDDRRSRRSSVSDDNRRMSDDENAQRQKEKEPEPEPIPERRIDVEIPRIVSDLGKEIHFVKLPNFLSVETRPFDRDTYEDEIDEEETLDEEGRQRIKLKVSNTIRWREYFDDDGNVKRESNARMVRWDDGSISLHLGNEIFDVYKQPLQGDFNHLFIRQGTGLQGQAVFRTKLTFRPYSTESFTHKKMTMSLADRSQKTAGIKILTTVGSDPDANRYIKLKKEEEQLRQAMRQKTMQSKPKRNRDTAAGLSASYREEHDSDDEGAISIAAIKNKYTGKGGANTSKQGAAIYSSDEDESDFETRRSKKTTDKAKVLRAIADSDDESVGSNRNVGSGNESNANESKTGSDSD